MPPQGRAGAYPVRKETNVKRILIAASAALAAPYAAAQAEEPATGQALPPPPPSCDTEVYRQFDFWAGDWEVFNPAGDKAGDNSITIEEKGCLLVERWTGLKGGTGQSYNYVDFADGKWRQIWVSAGATIDYKGGLNEKGEMVLEGPIAYRNGKTAPFRGVWTANADGSLTQHFEEFNAEKKEWGDWFTGLYKKNAAAK
jgi:hypothetical protein